MPLNTIHPDLVGHALSRVKGGPFEEFSQEFLAALIGPKFVPIGGTNDGGADGLVGDRVFDEAGDPRSFMQASVQEEEVERKIRTTVERLRDFGRDPRSLRYVTSREIKHVDRVESTLSAELDVAVRILSGSYIAAHINDSPQTVASFEHYLRPVTEYLRFPGASPMIARSKHVESPAVYVFLRQEVERRAGDTTLVDAVTDALILWALDGTDPGTGNLMSMEEIAERICSTVPFAKVFVTERLEDRLAYLSAKGRNPGRVRWHRKDRGYVLPYETRSQIELENIQDEVLRLAVIDGLRDRIAEHGEGDLSDDEIDNASQVALRSLQLLFEQEGLELAAYISSKEESENTLETVQDAVRVALAESGVRPKRQPITGDHVLGALRGVFYSSSDAERQYLGKLSRTYSLLFTLNAEPRLVSYFQEMSGDFYLYVGSDVLVRALSERYLKPADQMTRNVLRMAAEAGATLVLAEPVLDEVLGNLRASDTEFEVNFAALGDTEFREAELMSPRILVRTYFHARTDPILGAQRPDSWPNFVNQFVDYDALRRPKAEAQLKGYLLNEFNMVFESRSDLEKLVDDDQLVALTEAFTAVKDHKRSVNDALLALAVYGRRETLQEHAKTTEFGHRTWWLTGETKIRRYTKGLIRDNMGSRFMMRPEFLLNFLAFAPSAAEVRATYANVFPTVLGVQLSKRMDENVFHGLMKKVRESEMIEPGRRKAQMAQLVDDLKGDFRKEYQRGFEQ